MHSMRALHILNHTERLSGNVHAAVDLACAQAKAGYSVAVISKGGDFDDVFRACGVEVFKIDIRRSVSHLLKAELLIFRLFRRWRPDVVHAHMMTSAILSFPVCQLLRLPLITSVHNAFERSAIFMTLGRRAVAVSASVGSKLRRQGFSKSRLRVVLNGTIGSARHPVGAISPTPLSSPAVVFVGGLHPRKGVKDLISAFALVSRNVAQGRLYIVGEGPDAGSYQAMVRDRGLQDRVTFCGPQDDPRLTMRSADIFVLPSLADPAPLVISEAREAGCAVIASNVDGIPEMLEGGRAGLLVPPSNPEALAAAIQSLLQDASLLKDWKERSQINIRRLRLDRVVEDMHAVYLDALYERPPVRPIAAERPSRVGA